jgi:hypothetical protein
MSNKNISTRGKKWRAEGWLSVTPRDFGFGFHLYRWRSKNSFVSTGVAINIYLLFLDFHLEIWKRP